MTAWSRMGVVVALGGSLYTAVRVFGGAEPWTALIPWLLALVLALHLRDYVRAERIAVHRVRIRQVLQGGHEWTGYELHRRAGVAPGTLYPLLAMMEQAGEVTSRWGVATIEGGPRPRLYRLRGGS